MDLAGVTTTDLIIVFTTSLEYWEVLDEETQLLVVVGFARWGSVDVEKRVRCIMKKRIQPLVFPMSHGNRCIQVLYRRVYCRLGPSRSRISRVSSRIRGHSVPPDRM